MTGLRVRLCIEEQSKGGGLERARLIARGEANDARAAQAACRLPEAALRVGLAAVPRGGARQLLEDWSLGTKTYGDLSGAGCICCT